MQPVTPAPPRHGPPGKLIHNHHLPALGDIAHVFQKQLLRLDRIDQKRRPLLPRIVQIRDLQHILRGLVPLLRQQHIPLLLVHRIMHVLHQNTRNLIRFYVLLRRFLRRPGDDQRRARLINQDRVHLVDDAKVETAGRPQHELVWILREVIAQVIKPKLRVGHVGDVRRVRRLALLLTQTLLHKTDIQTKEPMDLPHPLTITPGQVVVHRHHVHPLARQRVEVRWKRGHQRLPLSRAHLRNLTFVKNHTTDQLHVKRTKTQHALRRLPDDRKRLHQQLVQRLPRADPPLELGRLLTKLLVR
mmetsp:Transcript_2821/g.8426  ORF Transcript_2821/g.8426 Transcript_2821/m.8426 type:complete len:301 (+) Transcript_2821:2052-2954(+)